MQKQITFFLFLLFFFINSLAQKNEPAFGNASFYHDKFHGRETSNGEVYDKDDFTAAHKTYPFNTILLVTNKKNNKSVVVRINDRGPFKRSRVLDLSSAAAKKIGMVPYGVVPVKIKVLNFLNPSIMNDSWLKDGEIWDCYSKKRTLENSAIYVWHTSNWKHAFYMASCLSLEYNLNSLAVRVKGNQNERKYELIVTDVERENIAKVNQLLALFRKDGFSASHVLK
jgi:rare lipoprotein A